MSSNYADALRTANLADSQEDHERVIHLNTPRLKYVRDVVQGDTIRMLTGEPATVVSLTVMRVGDLEYAIVKAYYVSDGAPVTNRLKTDSTVEVFHHG